jgi:hypothetical protein
MAEHRVSFHGYEPSIASLPGIDGGKHAGMEFARVAAMTLV